MCQTNEYSDGCVVRNGALWMPSREQALADRLGRLGIVATEPTSWDAMRAVVDAVGHALVARRSELATVLDDPADDPLDAVIEPLLQANEHLRQADVESRAMRAAALDGIIVMGADGRITEVNATAERMFGWSRDSVMGRPAAEVILPPAQRAVHTEEMARYVARGGHGESPLINRPLEVDALRADGREIPTEMCVTCFRGAGGLLRFAVYVHDISRRREREAELKRSHARLAASVAAQERMTAELSRAKESAEITAAHAGASEERLSLALDAAQAGLWDWDVTTGQVLYSPGWTRMIGFEPAEVAPNIAAFEGLLHPDDRERVAARLADHFAGRVEYRNEFRLRTKAGTYRWVMATGKVVARDPETGAPTRMIGTHVDTDARRCAEHALHDAVDRLRDQQAYLRQVIDLNPNLIFAKDHDGRFTLANRAFAEAYGTTVEQLIGRTDFDFSPDPAQIRAYLAADRKVMREGVEVFVPEETITDRAGNWRIVQTTKKPLPDPDGVCRQLLGVSTDITALKRTEAERARSRELELERNRLRESITAMEHVMGVVGHELRTPLAGMRAVLEFLATGGASDEQREQFLRGLHTQVVRMSDIISNILEAARLNSGSARWNWAPFEVQEAVRTAVETTRLVYDVPGVRLSIDVEPADLDMYGDGDAVRRLLVNLLANAYRHTAAGHVRVIARARDDDPGLLVLTVNDTGEGIPADRLPQLGKPFALNAGSVGANYCTGTGLGLSICKAIASAHGGELTIDSTVGVGTTVTALLRRDLPAPARPSQRSWRDTSEVAHQTTGE